MFPHVVIMMAHYMNMITHDGSMVLLYMVLHGSHQYTPFMLAKKYQHHGSYGLPSGNLT